MSEEQNVLAIDVGTQSARAFVFGADGAMIDGARAVYDQPYHSPQPGWAEQDPRMYWDKLAEVCHGLWRRDLARPESLAAVAVTTQRNTVVCLDAQARPLRPAIVWLDQRRASDLRHLGRLWRALFGVAGLGGTIDYLMAEAEANWLRQHQPEIWRQTAHYLFLSGYINHKLTGRFADSTACTVGYMPFDYKAQRWAGDLSWKWSAIPVPRRALPELVPPGRELGRVSAEAAGYTGLPVGLPVIAGASDKSCEVLGAGCLSPHQGCIGYGTTATINVNCDRYIEPIALVPPYPSAKAGSYNLEVQIFRGFWMVSWFKEQFAQLEQEAARLRGVEAEVLLEELASDVPAGSMGLVLQPFWSPGLRCPGPEAKGAIIGFGGAHKKQHLYRAMLEGLAFALRDGRERIQRRGKTKLSELYVCGGGSRSDLAMQITADVFNLPASRPAHFEASGLGAAMLACLGCGLHEDLSGAVRAMTATGRTFEPDRSNVGVYDELYDKVYRRMYKRLRPFYQRIMAVTGYPAPFGQD